jgi:hypothetical protein
MATSNEKSGSAGGDDISEVSLSAAILAPLSALIKAQIHSSRAFLSFLLQLGYSHQELKADNMPDISNPEKLTPFTLPFVNRVQINGRDELQRIEIPALALVPSVPLGVESAEFEFDFLVERCAPHEQLQASRTTGDGSEADNKRPWYLVDQPVSLRGQVADGGDKAGAGTTDKGWSRDRSNIHIKIKVGQMAVPSGLDKLLATLTQAATVHTVSGTAPPGDQPTS